MVNVLAQVKTALEATGLPVYYELALHSGCPVPCISYMELNQNAHKHGSTLLYNNISFMVKIWANDLGEVLTKRSDVESIMRNLGFTLTNTTTIGEADTMVMQVVLEFSALSFEEAN